MGNESETGDGGRGREGGREGDTIFLNSASPSLCRTQRAHQIKPRVISVAGHARIWIADMCQNLLTKSNTQDLQHLTALIHKHTNQIQDGYGGDWW